jgi:hypothetical protein
MTGTHMEAQNRALFRLTRTAFRSLAQRASTAEKPVRFEMVEVSFAQVPDAEARSSLAHIETSFNLSDRKVDSLISAARQILRDSPELARALSWLEREERNP